jgi:hypothetical protein
MRRLRVLLCVLLFAPGCASSDWDEFRKDLNGENRKMSYERSPVRGM